MWASSIHLDGHRHGNSNSNDTGILYLLRHLFDTDVIVFDMPTRISAVEIRGREHHESDLLFHKYRHRTYKTIYRMDSASERIDDSSAQLKLFVYDIPSHGYGDVASARPASPTTDTSTATLVIDLGRN